MVVVPALQTLNAANPWKSTRLGWIGVVLVLLITAGICWKQLSYYYRSGGAAAKAGVFQTVKAYSNREYTLDWALAVLGAGLIPVAWFYTPVWLAAFSLYCILGLWRCRLTLRRPFIAAGRRPPLRSGFLDTYPGRMLPSAPTDQEMRLNVQKVAGSLDQIHGTRRIPVKDILAGWVWSFRIHANAAAAAFLAASLSLALGKATLSVGVSIGGVVLVAVLFDRLSSRSLDWGKKNATRMIGGLRVSKFDWGVSTALGLILAAAVVLASSMVWHSKIR
ncbi:MAG: hypothetical protein WCA49_24210 [Candidatus Sulfotelmatobacter sp.]